MYSKKLNLSSIETVKKFVNLANRYDFPISVLSERYKVDAKSIMGIFSLDFSQPVELRANCPDGSDFPAKIAPYLVEQ